MKTSVTVEVDDRGRFTVPEPARRALSIESSRTDLRLRIRVLKPDSSAGNVETTDVSVDDRGRATITPAKTREKLGIRGRESLVEITLEKPEDDST